MYTILCSGCFPDVDADDDELSVSIRNDHSGGHEDFVRTRRSAQVLQGSRASSASSKLNIFI